VGAILRLSLEEVGQSLQTSKNVDLAKLRFWGNV